VTEQDVYSSNELLRNTDVSVACGVGCNFGKAKLVDPYSLLVREGSKFRYADQKSLQFDKEPHLSGKIVSAQLNDTTTTKSDFTYLTRGLSWTPRYDVIVIDDNCKSMDASQGLYFFVFCLFSGDPACPC
jgi:hypothetical protein